MSDYISTHAGMPKDVELPSISSYRNRLDSAVLELDSLLGYLNDVEQTMTGRRSNEQGPKTNPAPPRPVGHPFAELGAVISLLEERIRQCHTSLRNSTPHILS